MTGGLSISCASLDPFLSAPRLMKPPRVRAAIARASACRCHKPCQLLTDERSFSGSFVPLKLCYSIQRLRRMRYNPPAPARPPPLAPPSFFPPPPPREINHPLYAPSPYPSLRPLPLSFPSPSPPTTTFSFPSLPLSKTPPSPCPTV